MVSRVISEEELALHNNEKDLWVAIEGKVYNLTDYKTHPGGFQVLVEVAGRDGTAEFLDANHPSYIDEDMPQYYIGDLEQPKPTTKHKVEEGSKLRTINAAELELHCKPEDLWLAIHGKVYDVSKFNSHPGGPDILLEHGNMNATQAFEDHGHGEVARKMMGDYYIGEYFEGRRMKREEIETHNSSNQRKLLVYSNRAYNLEAFSDHPEIYSSLTSLTEAELLEGDKILKALPESELLVQMLPKAYEAEVDAKKGVNSLFPLLIGLVLVFVSYLVVTAF